MRESRGDFWNYISLKPETQICITTNGVVKSNGEAVMGRGIALQAKERYPGIAMMLGDCIKRNGNVFQSVYTTENLAAIWSFPVKVHWRDRGDLSLIEGSARTLAGLAESFTGSNKTYLLPRPGCGNGKRDWLSEVKPVIEAILPDNVVVISLEE